MRINNYHLIFVHTCLPVNLEISSRKELVIVFCAAANFFALLKLPALFLASLGLGLLLLAHLSALQEYSFEVCTARWLFRFNFSFVFLAVEK